MSTINFKFLNFCLFFFKKIEILSVPLLIFLLVKKTSKLFRTDEDINMRIQQYWPLICIRWCLIILLKSDKSDCITQRIKSEKTLKRICVPYYLSE